MIDRNANGDFCQIVCTIQERENSTTDKKLLVSKLVYRLLLVGKGVIYDTGGAYFSQVRLACTVTWAVQRSLPVRSSRPCRF